MADTAWDAFGQGLIQGSYLGSHARDRRQSRIDGAEHARLQLELLKRQIAGEDIQNAAAMDKAGLAMRPTGGVNQHPLDTPEFGAARGRFVNDLGDALGDGFGAMKAPPGIGGTQPLGPTGIPDQLRTPITPGGLDRVAPGTDSNKELRDFGVAQAAADVLQRRDPSLQRDEALLQASGDVRPEAVAKTFDPATDPEVQRRAYLKAHGLLWEPNQPSGGKPQPGSPEHRAAFVQNRYEDYMKPHMVRDPETGDNVPTYPDPADARRRAEADYEALYPTPIGGTRDRLSPNNRRGAGRSTAPIGATPARPGNGSTPASRPVISPADRALLKKDGMTDAEIDDQFTTRP